MQTMMDAFDTPQVASRKRYGRKRGARGEDSGDAPGPQASAPQRMLNAINPFHNGSAMNTNNTNAAPVPTKKAATKKDPFTLQETKAKKSGWGWKTSKVQPQDPNAQNRDEDGAVIIEIGPLIREARNPKSEGYKERTENVRQREEIFATAIQTNQESVDMALRMERIVDVTERIGERTIVQLQQQGEQIDQTQTTVDDLSPMMNRARMEMVKILRQLWKDKVFMCLCISVFACCVLAFIIVVRKSIDGGSNGEAEATPVPPTPQPITPTPSP